MKHARTSNETKAIFERAVRSGKQENYVLRLYIAGLTPRSTAAVESVKRLCEEYLQGRYDLEIIDIYHNPTLAKGEQIIAAPTLIKKLPLPLRRLIGDMADEKKFLIGMDLRSKTDIKAIR
ncbi:MAG TPA: circadian clock KaiB family protein [Bacteroidota bacterium]|nr:circadian clock KaiB family protein [Bacteroidota bacterium]